MHFYKRMRGCGPAPKMFLGHGFGHHRGKFGSGGGGAGRRGKRFAGEELELMVLGLIGEQPQHGYQLIRSFAEKSGEAYVPSPGVLYPLLSMLQDKGLIEDILGERKDRKVFDLTESGKAEVEARQAEIETALARLAAMGEEAGRADPAPVRRAMMNLRTAAIQRMTSGTATDETAFAIAALLDEAAQKIERL